jgi:hypothetical protein
MQSCDFVTNDRDSENHSDPEKATLNRVIEIELSCSKDENSTTVPWLLLLGS